METKDQHAQVTHNDNVMDEKVTGKVTSVNTNSVALAAALASQKPSLLSRNMIQLYLIMAIGYLVSTMNGFGKSVVTCLLIYFHLTLILQTARSWVASTL